MHTGPRTSGPCIHLQIAFSFHVRANLLLVCTLLTIAVAPRLGLPVNYEALSSVTRGFVGDTSFAVLPEVSKEHTFALTLLFQLVGPLPSDQPFATLTQFSSH